MKSEAIWYLGERSIEIRSIDIPEPSSSEVVVEMEVCGVCGWDNLAYMGKIGKHHPYPFAAGHEGVGRIVKCGQQVTTVRVGQRVALHEVPVGVPGGALMARHALRAVSQVTAIPEDSTPIEYWIVEPVVCVLNGILHCGAQPGDRVAVIGAGYMGLLFIQGLSHNLVGEITAFDINTARFELANRFGADRLLNVREKSSMDDIRESFDVVVETAGSPEAIELAMAAIKPGGNIETFAWHHHSQTFDLDVWHVKGVRILNIQPGMNPHFGDLFARAVSLMARGTFSNRHLVTHVSPMKDARSVFEAAADGSSGYIKGVVSF